MIELLVALGLFAAFIFGVRALFDHLLDRAQAQGLPTLVAELRLAELVRRELERSVERLPPPSS